MTGGEGKARKGADWKVWDYSGTGLWPEKWPPVRFQQLSDKRIYFEMTPPADAANMLGGLHGGFLASYAEHVLGIFVVPFELPVNTLTVSLNFDYPAGGVTGLPVEGYAELVRETRRMQFVRLELMQGDQVILTGSGVLRKVPRT